MITYDSKLVGLAEQLANNRADFRARQVAKWQERLAKAKAENCCPNCDYLALVLRNIARYSR